MADEPPRRLRAALVAGRLAPGDGIDRALEYLDAEPDPVRERALRTVVAATESRPDRVIDAVDAVEASLVPGRAVTAAELGALRDLGRRRPRALSPLVDTFATALSNPDESEVRPALVARLVGDVGAEAPGVAKPALGPLADLTEAGGTTTATEAAWAVARTATTEPATLRPVVAGRVWDLDSDDPGTVVGALETLGRIGWILPDHLAGLDEVAALVDHPVSAVRAAAVRALGRVAGVHPGASLGIPGPDRVEPYLGRLVDRLSDPDPGVRGAAAAAVEGYARQDPGAAGEHVDELLGVVDDDRWEVRAAALESLEHALDPATLDFDRFQDRVLPRLADDDADVEAAAVSLLATFVEAIEGEHPAVTRHVIDLLAWAQFTASGLFDAPEPLGELEERGVALPDAPRYVAIARAIRDVGGDADGEATAKLCGVVARQYPEQRFPAIGILQSLLADDGEGVRRQVLAEFERLVEADPALAPTLWHVAETVFAYDPAVRDEAATLLTACDGRNPPFLADAVELQVRFLRETVDDDENDEDDDGDLGDLFGSGPSSAPLETFVESAPPAVADAALTLLDTHFGADDTAESGAPLLARAVAEGATVEPETVAALEEIVRAEDQLPSLVGWLSTALLLGAEDPAVRDRAVDRLHSLIERPADTPVPACLGLLADERPDTVARLLATHPPIAALPPTEARTMAAVAAAHPRLSLRCRGRDSPFSVRPVPRAYSNDTEWLAELAETVPQTVRASERLRDGFRSDDGELTAKLLETVGRGGAVPGEGGAATWTAHPDPAVRTAARALDGDGDATPSGSLPTLPGDGDTVTTDTVDEIATDLASDADRCRRAAESLVTVGADDPDLRSYVRQHLLASVVSVGELAAPDSLLGALVTLAPGPRDDSAQAPALEPIPPGELDRDTVTPVIRRYARFGTPPVRDAALCALRSLPVEAVDPAVADLLVARLRDPDATVRAGAARAVARLAGAGLDVGPPLVDAVVDALDGPRHVTIAGCDALGHLGDADPSLADRAVSELEVRLRARERGVRRAAATALARVGAVEPDALVPVADTLAARLREDRAARDELLPAIAALPVDEIPNHDRVAAAALAALETTDRPPVSQATGRLLASLADASPGSVRIHLDDVSERLEERYDDSFMPDLADTDASSLSLYWLLRVVGTCARGNPRIAEGFEWLISEAVEQMTDVPADGTATYGPSSDDNVTARGLARVAARAAALGGLACYETVLEGWPADPRRPDPDPAETACHLTVTTGELRTDALDALVEHAPPTRVDAVVAALLDHEITLNRHERVFDSLAELLPLSADKRLHRRGVSVLLDASRGGNWEVRADAVDTLAELGGTAVVPADEVVAHLLGLFDDSNRVGERIAAAVADLLQHAQLDAETVFAAAVRRYERSRDSPNARKTAVRLVSRLGTYHRGVRDRAVRTLLEAVSDDDRWVRERAADGLAELGSVAPAAIRPYRDRIEALAAEADTAVSRSLDSCLRGEGPPE